MAWNSPHLLAHKSVDQKSGYNACGFSIFQWLKFKMSVKLSSCLKDLGKNPFQNSFILLVNFSSIWLKSLYFLSFFLFLMMIFDFFFKFIYFNWRLITLQYYIGFAYFLVGSWRSLSDPRDCCIFFKFLFISYHLHS